MPVGIGIRIRHRLGRWEAPAARLYRSLFVDLRALADQLAAGRAEAGLQAKRILEVGCGDGAFGQELTRAFPGADYLGIDIAATAGRLFRGDPARCAFRVVSARELLAEDPEPFDLVCLVDVLHHVPAEQRPELLGCAAALTAPEGHLAIKDLLRDGSAGYHAAFVADRFITGDAGVAFMSRTELLGLISAVAGFGPVHTSRVPPLRTNVLYVRQRRSDPG
jgi:2-polyprenyl-6-hydroxyphenyl methylase/3-demethylubiquinone-9 3-methyltransferase